VIGAASGAWAQLALGLRAAGAPGAGARRSRQRRHPSLPIVLPSATRRWPQQDGRARRARRRSSPRRAARLPDPSTPQSHAWWTQLGPLSPAAVAKRRLFCTPLRAGGARRPLTVAAARAPASRRRRYHRRRRRRRRRRRGPTAVCRCARGPTCPPEASRPSTCGRRQARGEGARGSGASSRRGPGGRGGVGQRRAGAGGLDAAPPPNQAPRGVGAPRGASDHASGRFHGVLGGARRTRAAGGPARASRRARGAQPPFSAAAPAGAGRAGTGPGLKAPMPSAARAGAGRAWRGAHSSGGAPPRARPPARPRRPYQQPTPRARGHPPRVSPLRPRDAALQHRLIQRHPALEVLPRVLRQRHPPHRLDLDLLVLRGWGGGKGLEGAWREQGEARRAARGGGVWQDGPRGAMRRQPRRAADRGRRGRPAPAPRLTQGRGSGAGSTARSATQKKRSLLPNWKPCAWRTHSSAPKVVATPVSSSTSRSTASSRSSPAGLAGWDWVWGV
jgi:hypothetical protein